MRLKINTIFFLFFVIINGTAQISQSGDFHAKINGIITALPGSSGSLYSIPNSTETNTWESALASLINGNYTTAHNKLTILDYQLTIYTDNSQTPNKIYYILEKQNAASNYWGTYVYNPNGCNNNLIIQSPHARYDSNTGQEGALVFTHADALFFMTNGTHRCNHSSFSSCSGTTSSCGTSQNFRISDMAHNDNSIFQVTTDFLFNNSASNYFVQLHGFGKQPTDPSVIMSNGTRDTPAQDYISAIQQNLFALDNNLDFKIAHIDLTWTRLIGFTNTQGRLINGEAFPCTNSANATTGRFIHLEQEKPLLRQDSTKWAIMAEAIKLSFDCSVSVNEYTEIQISVYPNPTNGQVTIEGEIERVSIYTILGEELIAIPISSNSINLKHLGNGTYLVKVELKSGKILFKKVVLSH